MAIATYSEHTRDLQLKTCTKCGESKPIDLFSPDKRTPSGLRNHCKDCRNAAERAAHIADPEKSRERQRRFNKKHIERLRAEKREYYHRTKKISPKPYISPEQREEKKRAYMAEWRAKNKELITTYNRQYSNDNRDRLRPIKREWTRKNSSDLNERKREDRQSNPDKYREYDRKRLSTPKGKIDNAISKGIRHRLKNGGKRGVQWEKLVGYTTEELVVHLERQFTKGMTWDNYGRGGWNIDHIIPAISFKYDSPEDPEFKACWALSNLRPLWEKENISKHAKRLTLL